MTVDILAEIRSHDGYDGLVEAFRLRREALDISCLTLDQIAGLPAGYCGKLLGRGQVKRMGPFSFGPILGALGLKLVVVEDPDQLKNVHNRHDKRRSKRDTERLGQVAIKRAFSAVAQEMGRRGGRATFSKLTPAQLRRHQQRAIRARWKRSRA